MPPPPATPRLVFRELADADLDALAGLLADAEVMRYSWIGVRDRAGSLAVLRDMQRTYRSQGFGKWGLWLRDTESFVGYAGLDLYPIEGREQIELGYRLHRAFWGQGLASEAARAVMAHAFGPLQLPQVQAFIHPPNAASGHVLEKVGFRQVGPVTMHGETMLLFRAERA